MKKNDFLKLMGKGKRCWKYVNTKQDLIDLKEFEDLFIRMGKSLPQESLLIPESIHFVWLGEKEYPETSKKYLLGWIDKHRGWKVILWSDRERKFMPEGVEIKRVDSWLLKSFHKLYEDSDNFGERSDLVRLIVLHEMGGVYVDHDMECRVSFRDLHRTYPFYGGLLTPGNPVIHRSAIVRNSVIGACPRHPILMKALKKAESNWEEIKALYPGNDVDSIKKRVTLRVFKAFHDSVLEAIKEPNFEGIIFPAGFFNEIEREFGIFAKEDMCGAWYTEEMNHHEKYLNKRLHQLMKRLHLVAAIFGLLILILFALVLGLWVKIS
jgi:hypothetical protein